NQRHGQCGAATEGCSRECHAPLLPTRALLALRPTILRPRRERIRIGLKLFLCSAPRERQESPKSIATTQKEREMAANFKDAAASVLDPERLCREAEQATGLSQWGEPPFLDALERLCRSAVDEAGLEGAGLQSFAN